MDYLHPLSLFLIPKQILDVISKLRKYKNVNIRIFDQFIRVNLKILFSYHDTNTAEVKLLLL